MTRTRYAVILLAAAGLLLTGCSSSPPKADGRPATHQAATPTASNSPARTSDDAYVQQARNNDPGDFTKTDPSIITPEGHTICTMLAAGQTVEATAARIREDFNEQATNALIAAVPALCPDQQTAITAWASAQK